MKRSFMHGTLTVALGFLFVACAVATPPDELTADNAAASATPDDTLRGQGATPGDAGSSVDSSDASGNLVQDADISPPLDAAAESDASDAVLPLDAAAPPSQDAGDGSVQQLCVDTINAYRATVGLPPLARWSDAESCVDGEAATDMAANIAHSAIGTCVTPNAKAWAQNECFWYPLPIDPSLLECFQQMWDEGPGEPYEEHSHYINMTNPAFTKVACGFAISADGKTFWATQDFQ
ncbi:MAG: CAP domain-containing protein [Polyangiaceae bacterium]|nr:CAP domain-containing protein [Polyangiaceae bacterium]